MSDKCIPVAPFPGMDKPWTQEEVEKLDTALKSIIADPTTRKDQSQVNNEIMEKISVVVDRWRKAEICASTAMIEIARLETNLPRSVENVG